MWRILLPACTDSGSQTWAQVATAHGNPPPQDGYISWDELTAWNNESTLNNDVEGENIFPSPGQYPLDYQRPTRPDEKTARRVRDFLTAVVGRALWVPVSTEPSSSACSSSLQDWHGGADAACTNENIDFVRTIAVAEASLPSLHSSSKAFLHPSSLAPPEESFLLEQDSPPVEAVRIQGRRGDEEGERKGTGGSTPEGNPDSLTNTMYSSFARFEAFSRNSSAPLPLSAPRGARSFSMEEVLTAWRESGCLGRWRCEGYSIAAPDYADSFILSGPNTLEPLLERSGLEAWAVAPFHQLPPMTG